MHPPIFAPAALLFARDQVVGTVDGAFGHGWLYIQHYDWNGSYWPVVASGACSSLPLSHFHFREQQRRPVARPGVLGVGAATRTAADTDWTILLDGARWSQVPAPSGIHAPRTTHQ